MSLTSKAQTIKTQVDGIKETLGLSASTPLEDINTSVELAVDAVENIDVFKVATIAERDLLTAKDGDICVVYSNSQAPMSNPPIAGTYIFPDTVTFDSAISSNYYIDMYSNVEISIRLTNSMCRVDVDHNTISYTSNDGITYTKSSGISDITLPSATWDVFEFDTECTKFMILDTTNFPGIFEYKNNSWSYLNIGMPIQSDFITKDKQVYSNSGKITGTMYDSYNYLLDDDWNNYTEVYLNYINNIKDWSTSRRSDGQYGLFKGLTSKYLPILNLINNQNLTSMKFAFSDCSNLIEIPKMNISIDNQISNFEIRNAFSDCTAIKKIDISNLTLTSCNEIISICGSDSNLEEFNAPTITTNTVMDMRWAFRSCSSLVSLDLSKFTFKLDTITKDYSTYFTGGYAFNGCTNLQHLDIRNIDILSTVDNYMFTGVPNNCSIIVKNQTSKDNILTKFPNLTNITVA